ncbi:YfiR family protein [Vibrio gallaecicus]|uniref:YfiR family protein n=2 Tax=Vibrio gallaecicus TaxID=552386 RepID=UPI0010C94CA2|nr:YfiR family protein [Vibrio gallaecicus]MDN3617065.1 YfiR family protein [Vibrio gallaecicus]
MNFKRVVFTLVLLVITHICSLKAYAASFKPYQVKAVYVFRMASFIRWTNESEMKSLNFCIIGDDKVKRVLSTITEGKVIRELPITVTSKMNEECNVTYVTGYKSTFDRKKYTTPSNVTISDQKNFTKQGGVIELQTVNSQIKPKINLDNVQLDDYTIGSNLLRIATVEGK